MNNKDLIRQYVGTGQKLPYSQFVQIEKYPNLLKSYLRARNLAREEIPLEWYEMSGGQEFEVHRIFLGYRLLDSIPKNIDRFINLMELSLVENNIKDIDAVTKLINLKKLILTGNRVEVLPDSIGDLKQLIQLQLNNNQLTTLPDSITQLDQLVTLGLEGNLIFRLPKNIGGLRALTTLDLSYNEIKSLPKSIIELQNLWSLNLRGNPISESEIESLRNELPNCEIRF